MFTGTIPLSSKEYKEFFSGEYRQIYKGFSLALVRRFNDLAISYSKKISMDEVKNKQNLTDLQSKIVSLSSHHSRCIKQIPLPDKGGFGKNIL